MTLTSRCLLGWRAAGVVGSAIEGTPFFTGFIALAIVALFFLVTQVRGGAEEGYASIYRWIAG